MAVFSKVACKHKRLCPASAHIYINESKIAVSHTIENECELFNLITKPELEQQQEKVIV
jgi:hypothetical protein